jgi:hypothetical protein
LFYLLNCFQRVPPERFQGIQGIFYFPGVFPEQPVKKLQCPVIAAKGSVQQLDYFDKWYNGLTRGPLQLLTGRGFLQIGVNMPHIKIEAFFLKICQYNLVQVKNFQVRRYLRL